MSAKSGKGRSAADIEAERSAKQSRTAQSSSRIRAAGKVAGQSLSPSTGRRR